MDNLSNANDSKTQAFDPGWNDPPKLSYSTQSTTPNRPRNFLNKRVAFPLSNAPPGQPPATQSLPPMPNAPIVPSVPPTLPPVPPTAATIDPVEQLNQNTLREVKEILLQFLEDSRELGSKSNDIKRRLGIMEEMWLSDRLNATVHQSMKELAYALRDDVPDRADEIHKALMVDHVGAVGTWMPGVKQLIHHLVARNELLSIEKEQLRV